jgi:hypothetical protein
MGIQVAALTALLDADTSKFHSAMDQADKTTRGFGDKVQDAGKKMSVFATVPIVAFLGSATKAAVEDAAAQDHLAKTLQNVGEKAPIEAIEKFIGSMTKASTFSDDQLRPSFETLVRSTGEAEHAMDLLEVAMDVAAGKGIPLETATLAVTKASEGQFAAVNKLVPGLLDLKDKTLTAEGATKKLADLFSGQASAATETAAGKAAMMKRDLGELTEQMGSALVPILGKVVEFVTPLIEKFTNMSSGTQTAILVVLGLVAAIGPLIGLVTALSTAMAFLAANPVVLIIAGIAALAAVLVLAYKHSETFRNIVNGVFGAVKTVILNLPLVWLIRNFTDLPGKIGAALSGLANIISAPFKAAFGAIARLWNSTVGQLSFKVPGWVPGIGDKGFQMPKLPEMHSGGIVPGPRGANVPIMAQAGERVIPAGGGMGGNTYNINVNVAPGGNLAEAGRQMVEALVQFERSSGNAWRTRP